MVWYGVGHSRNVHTPGSSLNRDMPGRMFASMPIADLVRKMGVAMLAVAVLIAAASSIGSPASASPPPCDCPSMHLMHMSDMGSHKVPMKQPGAPCKSQSCLCGFACSGAVAIPHPTYAVFSRLALQHVAPVYTNAGHGISIRPALPPPILNV